MTLLNTRRCSACKSLSCQFTHSEAIKLSTKNKEADNPTYHYHLGLAYAKAEQPVLARQHLERVLKLDPKYSDADDVRKQLAQLKS